MIARILVTLALIVLGAGFIFFAGNVIWLGTREFFKIYGPKKDAGGAKTGGAASTPTAPVVPTPAATPSPSAPVAPTTP